MRAPYDPASFMSRGHHAGHQGKARAGVLSGKLGGGAHIKAFSRNNEMNSVPDSVTGNGVTTLQDTCTRL